MNSATQSAQNLYDYEVMDSNGSKIGSIDGVWVDDATDQLEFVAVKTGMIFGKNHMIPMENAQVDSNNQTVQVPYSKDQVDNAPSFDSNADLSPDDENSIYDYYGMSRSTAPSPSGLATGTGTTGYSTTSTDTDIDSTATDTGTRDITWNAGDTDTDVNANVGNVTTGTGTGISSTEMPTPPTDVSVPQVEEELQVGKRVVSAGQVRLRKVVRTEQQEVPVELRREDVNVERVSAADVDAVPDDAFQEQTIDIPVMREEAVVAKEAHVTGGVRITKDVETEQQQVSGEVRRTDVEVDDDSIDTANAGNTTFGANTGSSTFGTTTTDNATDSTIDRQASSTLDRNTDNS